MNFFSKHLTCVCRPRDDANNDAQINSNNSPETEGYKSISTLTLKDYLKDCQESESLNNFLDSIPYGSNYTIYNTPLCTKGHSFVRYSPIIFPLPLLWSSETYYCDCCGYKGTLYEKSKSYHTSKTMFRNHVAVHNLDHECRIMMNGYQVKKLISLQKKNENRNNGIDPNNQNELTDLLQ